MNPLIAASLLDVGKSLIERWFPDKEEQARAERDFLMAFQEKEFKQVIAQLEINAKEAQHPSVFVSGGRPAAIWVSVAGLAYATIIQNILHWVALIMNWPAPPSVDIDTLMYILGGLLGLSGIQSFDKVRGVASK